MFASFCIKISAIWRAPTTTLRSTEANIAAIWLEINMIAILFLYSPLPMWKYSLWEIYFNLFIRNQKSISNASISYNFIAVYISFINCKLRGNFDWHSELACIVIKNINFTLNVTCHYKHNAKMFKWNILIPVIL